ncbi:sugar transferase [Bryobacter aggregatus]|uniref:sugar transferase n=1 Tax=Bryobacter aggregatus TaxID=360054 RepID=UPI0004E2062E|nr:sugar transferase [Bryobacter aggregatus]
MYSRHHRKSRVLFALSDVLLTALAFEAAYLLRSLLPLTRDFYLNTPLKMLLFGIAALSSVIFCLWVQVYDRLDGANPYVIFRETLKQAAFNAITLILFEYTLRLDLSRGFLLLFIATQFLFLLLFRWNAGSLVGLIRREFGGQHYVLVFGEGPAAEELARQLRTNASSGTNLLGIVNHPDEVRGKIRDHIVDEVLFAVPPERLSGLEELFLECDEEGVRTRLSVDFFPHVNSDVFLDRLGPTHLLTFSATPHDEIKLFAKRIVDFLVAALALLAVSPILVLSAIAIRLSSKGPILFRQTRCGLNGRRFRLYKFRSMVVNAEALKEQYAHLNVKKLNFKIPNDPRLTGVGRWLRKFSIDELPQLWNVLKGDMSLVGPRPATPDEVENYERWQRRRLRMRPGLTCIWAVEGRDHLDVDTVMRLDMQYIDNWSLSLDSRILIRTIPLVLLGRGAN